MGTATPPEAETRYSSPAPKTITSSRFHAPPPHEPGRSATICGAPPAASIFLILPSDGYAMNRLSADHNGTPSAAVNSRDSPDSRECTHNRPAALKATFRPSGETLNVASSALFSGAAIWKRSGRDGAVFSRKERTAIAHRPSARADGILHASQERTGRAGAASTGGIVPASTDSMAILASPTSRSRFF